MHRACKRSQRWKFRAVASRRCTSFAIPTSSTPSLTPCHERSERRGKAKDGWMPELPDVVTYIHALKPRIVGQTLEGVRIGSASLLRTADPALSEFASKPVVEIRRIGKRIAI